MAVQRFARRVSGKRAGAAENEKAAYPGFTTTRMTMAIISTVGTSFMAR
jgi:hypothetical protein